MHESELTVDLMVRLRGGVVSEMPTIIESNTFSDEGQALTYEEQLRAWIARRPVPGELSEGSDLLFYYKLQGEEVATDLEAVLMTIINRPWPDLVETAQP